MTAASAFSGAGLADRGLTRAGFDHIWFCEVIPVRRSVLRRHYPGRPICEDVRILADEIEKGVYAAPDLFWFSPPCQDLSVAGLKAGLAGERSGLFFDGIRAVKSLRDRGTRYVVMEQVPGLLMSNSFGDLLQVLTEFAALRPVSWGYRILDAQYFAVAQVRRRVFFVLDFGGERAGEILSLTEGLRGSAETCGSEGRYNTEEASRCADTELAIGFRDKASACQTMRVGSIADTLTRTHSYSVLTKARMKLAKGNDSGCYTLETYVCSDDRPRRMTPREWERCFGLEDDYTQLTDDGKVIADSPRYEMLGDGVVANVSEWLGRRVLNLPRQ